MTPWSLFALEHTLVSFSSGHRRLTQLGDGMLITRLLVGANEGRRSLTVELRWPPTILEKDFNCCSNYLSGGRLGSSQKVGSAINFFGTPMF
nr:hypothetical protein Itr_chr03CG05980 [Ipomoea trifida]